MIVVVAAARLLRHAGNSEASESHRQITRKEHQRDKEINTRSGRDRQQDLPLRGQRCRGRRAPPIRARHRVEEAHEAFARFLSACRRQFKLTRREKESLSHKGCQSTHTSDRRQSTVRLRANAVYEHPKIILLLDRTG